MGNDLSRGGDSRRRSADIRRLQPTFLASSLEPTVGDARGWRLCRARLTRDRSTRFSCVPPWLGVAFNEQSNQAQERLMLGISPSAQKCPDLDIGQVTSRWCIRLMPDKYFPGARITAEKPPISIRAAVKLSSLHGHPFLPDLGYSWERRFRETRERRAELTFWPPDRSTVSASSTSSTDQTRNCSITLGSIAVFDKTRHLRACSRK